MTPPAARGGGGNRYSWYEIDDIQDLDIASSIFAPDDSKKLELIQNRYGGYWRYPHMIDFCYLVNPYFPPPKLIDEVKANAEKLLTQYPSGMFVNSLLAAKNFGVDQKNIVIGNGAAELIKVLMSRLTGKLGIVRPTFEEYPNRYDESETVDFTPQNKNFSYTADDLMNFFDDKNISNLVVINPDNPTGNYIPKFDVMRLIDWARAGKIFLVIDESFIDFANENDTLIVQEILDGNKNLCVMKSISKCFGVAGLRLGVAASGDEKLIENFKSDVAIWNINSFAEFYMQIAEKYKKDYLKALEIFRAERARFYGELQRISNLRTIPSAANYIMFEIIGGVSSKELTKILLTNFNILVKDLSAKIHGGNYIRVSVRDTSDNDKLLSALKQVLMK